jgi:hypothetical protein
MQTAAAQLAICLQFDHLKFEVVESVVLKSVHRCPSRIGQVGTPQAKALPYLRETRPGDQPRSFGRRRMARRASYVSVS